MIIRRPNFAMLNETHLKLFMASYILKEYWFKIQDPLNLPELTMCSVSVKQ